MKVPEYPLLPSDMPALIRGLRDYFPKLSRKVNGLGSGAFSEWDNATDTVPTVEGAQGDFVKKKTRQELGTSGSKYVIDGWEYIGTAWVQRRFLTGN